MVEPVRHRQTKGAEQICSNLKLPRHISTLPVIRTKADVIDVRMKFGR
jgi:hypothetical protein